jgi:hypothetical protein
MSTNTMAARTVPTGRTCSRQSLSSPWCRFVSNPALVPSGHPSGGLVISHALAFSARWVADSAAGAPATMAASAAATVT